MPEEIDDALLSALGGELMRFGRLQASPAGSRLERSAYRLLWKLVTVGPLTMGSLAEELQLDQSTVSRQVAAAVKHGHLERVAGEHGQEVRPTPEGVDHYRHDAHLRGEIVRAALASMGRERAERLVAELGAFNAALDDLE